jgi:hypothetical protein
MELLEKKYLVDNFLAISKLLEDKRIAKIGEGISVHYYGEQSGDNVKKVVEHNDHFEVHVFEKKDGKFVVTYKSPLTDKNAGFKWLRKQGFARVNIVTMRNTKFPYKNGTIGLYLIDDFLHSVILYYPQGEHDKIAKEFGLENATTLTVPYNKLLEQMRRLKSVSLDDEQII